MSTFEEDRWIAEIRDYCRSLDISTSDLHRIVTDLKIAPMVRGKAFEFSTYSRLKQLLPSEEWTVTKPTMNAQTGIHDIDVSVQHKTTGRRISVECKLAGKGGFQVASKAQLGVAEKGDYLIKVKYMRSRTTKTPAKVAALAQRLGVSSEAFLAHSDQYRASSFDVVATSIGNAFHETVEDEDGNLGYKFQPTEAGRKFIERLQPPASTEAILQEFVYNKVYLSFSVDLAVSIESGIICRKRECKERHNCGFIPNYPVINFGNIEALPSNQIPEPKNCWTGIERCQAFFNELLGRN